jgi:hypothetical protein
MKALNHLNAKDRMTFVYLENALNISGRKPIFVFQGSSLSELEQEIRDFLYCGKESKELIIRIYDKQFGMLNRKQFVELPEKCESVYARLYISENNDIIQN